MTDYQLQAVAVAVEIDGQSVFDDVTLGVSSGGLLVITGASGSGKSTLARVLCGVIEPARGDLLLRGRPLRDVTELELRPAFVPQAFGLISSLTVLENVTLPLQVCRFDKLEAHARALGWLQRLGIEACAKRLVGELSGGQRQRVSIARALALGPPVVVMDEPTAELDPANRDVVVSLLAGELRRGTALIVISHDEDVMAHASEVMELAPQPRR